MFNETENKHDKHETRLQSLMQLSLRVLKLGKVDVNEGYHTWDFHCNKVKSATMWGQRGCGARPGSKLGSAPGLIRTRQGAGDTVCSEGMN